MVVDDGVALGDVGRPLPGEERLVARRRFFERGLVLRDERGLRGRVRPRALRELRAVLGPSARVSELIQEADRNGDGMIDRQEFADLLRRL